MAKRGRPKGSKNKVKGEKKVEKDIDVKDVKGEDLEVKDENTEENTEEEDNQ